MAIVCFGETGSTKLTLIETDAQEIVWQYKLDPDIGRWWGNDPQNKKQTEVDIIANDHMFCECKWRNTPVDIDVLRKLQHRSDLILGHKYKGRVYFDLFSKTGFTDEVKNEATKKNNLLLFDINDLFHVGDQ